MTQTEDRSDRSILVAIDVAKLKNDVLIEAPGKRRKQRLRVLNTQSDHDRLIKHLSGLEGRVEVGFEATGNYHRPLAWRLLRAGFRLHLISSVALARTREAIHGGRDKNDPKDAQVMLHMLKTGLTTLALLIIVLNSLAMRPLYPLLVALGVTAVHLAYFAFAAADPRTIVTANYRGSANRELSAGF